MKNADSPQALASAIRAHALQMVHRADASHIGSCLSMTDLLAVLYARVLRVDPARPDWPERDRFILSKGHAAAAVYAVLAERGFFPRVWLDTYCLDDTRLVGHITRHGVPGVEVSTGSLGHGLGIGCGMALAGKRGSQSFRVFVMLSDGECDEGSTWEAGLFAPHHHLTPLLAPLRSPSEKQFLIITTARSSASPPTRKPTTGIRTGRPHRAEDVFRYVDSVVCFSARLWLFSIP